MIKKTADLSETSLADWIEGELLLGDAVELSITEILDSLTNDLGAVGEWDELVLAGVADEADDDLVLDLAEQDAELDIDALEMHLEFAQLELMNRRAMCGDRYPIVLDGDVLRMASPRPEHIEYAFLAALNLRRSLGLAEKVEHHRAAVLFERLVATALMRYLGGEARRFGVPLRPEVDGFAGTFPKRAQQLADVIGEMRRSDLPTIKPHQQDYGLDVIAWKTLDSRHGSVVVLCQCGIGADWDTKWLPRERWNEVIAFHARPVTALAFPFLIELDDDVSWDALAADSGLLLDRLRIAAWSSADDWEGLRDDIVDWFDDVLDLFASD